jgi:transposase
MICPRCSYEYETRSEWSDKIQKTEFIRKLLGYGFIPVDEIATMVKCSIPTVIKVKKEFDDQRAEARSEAESGRTFDY